MGGYPFTSGCGNRERFWFYIGDDGTEYGALTCFWYNAVMRIGCEQTHLKTLTMLDRTKKPSGLTHNIDEIFKKYSEDRFQLRSLK